ncbi:MAG: response regulator, partial [Zetaproteobacteria bacterium]
MPDRILVADDDEASRRGLKALLANWGYEVEEAADGQDALEKAAKFLPRVVVADVRMPKLDGLGLLNALRADFAVVTVILLTGQAAVETAVAAMKQG